MSEEEIRQAMAIFRRRWPDEQRLRITVVPSQERGERYELLLVLPRDKKQMRMVFPGQINPAMEKLAAVLDAAAPGTPKPEKLALHRPHKTLTEPVVVPAFGPPHHWQPGDQALVDGQGNRPVTVLAVVDQRRLLCKRQNGTLFHCQREQARLVVGGQ